LVGFLLGSQFPGFELYARLKPFLLAMVATKRDRWDHIDKVAGILLAGWESFNTTKGRDPCGSDDEMRQALRTGGDVFRRRLLWYLRTWSREDKTGRWDADALVLLRDVWPRDWAVRTEGTSEYLFDLAIDADPDRFPALVDAVTPLMTTLSPNALGVLEPTRNGDEKRVREPLALLKLLFVALSQNAADWPYGADSVVDRLATNSLTANDPRMAELRRRLAAR
jgi:hypothetical protein